MLRGIARIAKTREGIDEMIDAIFGGGVQTAWLNA